MRGVVEIVIQYRAIGRPERSLITVYRAGHALIPDISLQALAFLCLFAKDFYGGLSAG